MFLFLHVRARKSPENTLFVPSSVSCSVVARWNSAFLLAGLLVAAPVAMSAPPPESDPTEGEVIVTATRLATPKRSVASSTTVLTNDDLRKIGAPMVLDVLRDVPGLDVVQTGGLGGVTSVFIRGANPEHTVTLLDGIPMNDPSSPARACDLANIQLDGIDKIEVVRGPQSTLYGSDALAGVIQIFTLPGKGAPRCDASLESGAHHTETARLRVSGSQKALSYSVGISGLRSDGVSAAEVRDGNSERDGYSNFSGTTRLRYSPRDDLDLDLTYRYVDARSECDNFGGVGGDDPNNILFTRQRFLRIGAHARMFDGRWDQKVSLSTATHKRINRNETDSTHPFDAVDSRFSGDLDEFQWQNDVRIGKRDTLTVGFDRRKESADSDYRSTSMFGPYTSHLGRQRASLNGGYVQYMSRPVRGLTLDVGGRSDKHSLAEGKFTYRAASTYELPRDPTRIRATYGTGFKAPSLYQLFSEYGNRELRPEEVKAWDLGIERDFFHARVTAGLTTFRSDFVDLISFDDLTFKAENIARSRSRGIEASLWARMTPQVSVVANYTHTDAVDLDCGLTLLRREKDKYGLSLNYRSKDRKSRLNLRMRRVGSRPDMDFSTWPSERTLLPVYTVVSLSGSRQLARDTSVTVRVENLFDEHYQEVLGYGTLGASVYAGVRSSF